MESQFKQELRAKYEREINVLSNLPRYTTKSINELNISDYAVRTIYANNLVCDLSIEQINGIIFSVTRY